MTTETLPIEQDDTADVELAAAPPFITEPGVYTLGEAQYHRDPVVGGSLSSTGARTLVKAVPARFRYDQLHGREDRKVFDRGRAAHFYVLGQGMQVQEIEAKDWRKNATKEAAAKARADGRTPLLSKDVRVVEAMAEALRAHPTIGKLLARPGRAEQAMVYRDPATGVMCRVMIDWLPDVLQGRRLVVDYKTTDDASPDGFARSMAKYGYHQQGPFYTDGVVHLDLHNGHEPKFLLVVQEKDPPYLAAVYSPNDEAMGWGSVLNHQARETYAACVDADDWPGYSIEPQELALPRYVVGAYERAAEARSYEFDTVTEEDL